MSDQAVTLIEDYALAPSGWEALCRTIRGLTELQTSNRAIHQLLFRAAEPDARLLRERIEPLLSDIIKRAKAKGAVRADLSATDIPVLTHAGSSTASAMDDGGSELAQRHIELLIKGIALSPDDVPVPGPLPDEEFAKWLAALRGAASRGSGSGPKRDLKASAVFAKSYQGQRARRLVRLGFAVSGLFAGDGAEYPDHRVKAVAGCAPR